MNIRILTIFLATILVCTGAFAADITLTEITAVNGTPGSTVTGTFKVNAAANFTQIQVTSTNTAVSFSPSTFALNDGSTQTVSYTIVLAPLTAPSTINIPFTVKGDATTVTGQIPLTINTLKGLTLTDLTLSESNKNGTVSLRNTGNVDLSSITFSYDQNAFKDSSGKQITLAFNPTDIALIKPGETKTITLTSTLPTTLRIGEYRTTLTATASDTTAATSRITFNKGYCKYGRVGDVVEIERLKDESSTDEFEWAPLDEVTLEVKVRNNGDDNEDIVVVYDLYDPEDNDFVDLDNNDLTLSIDEGEAVTENFVIQVPEDLEEQDYRLYVKAYVEGDEDLQCEDIINGVNYETVSIEKESHQVVLKEIDFPETGSCGDTFEFTAKAYNVGSSDESDMKIVAYNKELGISVESSTFDLDEGDSKSTLMSIKLPQNATAKKYDFSVIALFDFDDNDDSYDKSAAYSRSITLADCQGGTTTPTDTTKRSVSIAAELQSDAKAGKEVTIKTTLKNTGDSQTSYSISASGYDSWATLSKIEPQSITLDKGESKDVTIILNAKSDASGDKEFVIRAAYSGKVTEQKVGLNIASSTTAVDLSKFTSALGENWFIWLIVLVNIVLIVLIIVAARRLAK